MTLGVIITTLWSGNGNDGLPSLVLIFSATTLVCTFVETEKSRRRVWTLERDDKQNKKLILIFCVTAAVCTSAEKEKSRQRVNEYSNCKKNRSDGERSVAEFVCASTMEVRGR